MYYIKSYIQDAVPFSWNYTGVNAGRKGEHWRP